MKALLVATAGPAKRAEFVLEPGKSYRVGRSHDADLVIDHASISRAHCRLIFAPPGKWMITDLGSRNGMSVNGRRVTTELLSDGDVVRLGKVTLEFHLLPSQEQPAAAPTPPPVPPPAPPIPAPAPATDTTETPSPVARGRKAPVAVAAAIVAAAIVGGVLFLARPAHQPLQVGPALPGKAKPGEKPAKKKVVRAPRKGRLIKVMSLADAKGLTPLHLAVKNGWRADAEALLAKGANVNAWDTPDPSDKSGRRLQPLHVAVIEDRADMAELLLNKGANPNGDLGSGTPIHIAAATNNVPLALLLLDRGAAVNARDAKRQMPLHLAALYGGEEVAECLVDRDAEVVSWASDGLTPLHLAAGGGHTGVLNVLLEAGGDPNLPNSYGHWTPLHEAALRGQKAAAELLIAKGADVNARTSTVTGGGSTPLHEAARAGHADLVKLLLARGADAAARNTEGRTPRDEALASSRREIAELLSH